MGSSKDDDTLLDSRPRVTLSEAPSAPAVLAGRYEVVSLLGVGGMGAVYRVRDRELDEDVALKILRRELVALPGMLERFRTEVKAARKVTSPNVARTFDIGEDGGDRFLTMELVEGASLEAEIEASPKGMPVARVIAIAEQVCRGLSAAHAVGVVHRDLKPDNVLVAKDGSAKITDFGIAKLEASARVTHGSVGTPAYMAPEQVTGEENIDVRADLYALGAMLYEMLTGELPWKGATIFAMASARLVAPPPDVRELRPAVPGPLADLVKRLMARDRAGRPSSAQEAAAAISGVHAEPVAEEAEPQTARAQGRHTRVAVLPFKNTGKPEDAYLADAVTDDVIDALSMAHGLRVFGRGAVIPFAHTSRDPRDVGNELGAHVVLHGSVERVGEEVRVRVRVLGVADGLQLRAMRFSKSRGELLSVGGEVARGVASALAAEAPKRTQTARDPEAVDLYLRGRRAYFGGEIPFRAESAELFKAALERAPDDPVFLAACAMSSALSNTTPEDLADSVELAERAVASAPHIAEARHALAMIRYAEGRPIEAAAELRAALDLAPSSPEINYAAGVVYSELGRFDDALKALEISRLLDPTLSMILYEMSRVHGLRGDYVRAHDIIESARDGARSPAAFISRLRLATWARDEKLLARFVDGLRGTPAADYYMLRAMLVTIDTGSWPEDTITASARRRAFAYQVTAEIAALRGNRERTVEYLEKANESSLIDVPWIELCPVFAEVRDEPRVRAVRASVAERAAGISKAFRLT
jgi:serine/threonine-protein kinase